MSPSREGYASPEVPHSTKVAEWLDELMCWHGVPEGERRQVLSNIVLLPEDDKWWEVLNSEKPHNYKLGYLAGHFLNWRDAGELPPDLLPGAALIERKARELKIE